MDAWCSECIHWSNYTRVACKQGTDIAFELHAVSASLAAVSGDSQPGSLQSQTLSQPAWVRIDERTTVRPWEHGGSYSIELLHRRSRLFVSCYFESLTSYEESVIYYGRNRIRSCRDLYIYVYIICIYIYIYIDKDRDCLREREWMEVM